MWTLPAEGTMAAGAGEAPKEEHNPMMHRVVVDEVPFKRKLVELTTHTTCAEAMQTLVDNKLETAPVWDEETRCYVGFGTTRPPAPVALQVCQVPDAAGRGMDPRGACAMFHAASGAQFFGPVVLWVGADVFCD